MIRVWTAAASPVLLHPLGAPLLLGQFVCRSCCWVSPNLGNRYAQIKCSNPAGSCTSDTPEFPPTINTQRTKSSSLKKLACERIYKENASGGRWDRPELHKALEHLRRGDVLVCWKLDRLSRSLSDLLRILPKVDEAGAKFKSLTEEIDTTTPMGRMVMQVVGSFAEFERSIIKERTKLGLARARANGRIGGGRYKLSATQQAEAIKMIRLGAKSQAEIAELFNVDRSTISRMMKEVREKELVKAVG